MNWRSLLGAFLSSGLSLYQALFQCSAQESVADFYKGKQITIAVGTPSGSSNSLTAQALARHMGRHLPGNPTFIVQHMPGAGGLISANHTYNNAPRDGTYFVITNRTLLIDPLLGGHGAQFDALNFTWIGSASVEHTTCVSWHTAPVKTLQQAFTRELVIGSYGMLGPSAVIAKAANKLTGTKFKVIGAYQGGPEAILAMQRGEVEGFCSMAWSELKLRRTDWLTQKRINLLFQTGFEYHPDIPHVPMIVDYAKTAEDRSVFGLLFASQDMGRPFYAPPGVPADRARALRAAFELTLKDPQFVADAEKSGFEIQYFAGESIQKLLERLYATPKKIIERAMTIAD